MGSEINNFAYGSKVENSFGRIGTVIDYQEYGFVWSLNKQYRVKWDDGEVEWVNKGRLWAAK